MDQGQELQKRSTGKVILTLLLWAVAPMCGFILFMMLAGTIQSHPRLTQIVAGLGVIAATAMQSYAYWLASRKKLDDPTWFRAVQNLFAFASAMMLILWAGMLAWAGFYFFNPDAPLPFGGR